MALILSSSGFGEGTPLPRRFTCDGDDISPPFSWSGAPNRTQSFVLVCVDPDAPKGAWYHWALYDLPSTRHEIEENVPRLPMVGNFRQAVNDFGHTGYGGPCPPKGSRPHRYRFHLTALSVPTLALPDDARCRDVEHAAIDHVLGEAVLTGTYARSD